MWPFGGRGDQGVVLLGKVLFFGGDHMRETHLRVAREHTTHSLNRWNILLAQSDRDRLLVIIDDLLAENTALKAKLEAVEPKEKKA